MQTNKKKINMQTKKNIGQTKKNTPAYEREINMSTKGIFTRRRKKSEHADRKKKNKPADEKQVNRWTKNTSTCRRKRVYMQTKPKVKC